MKNTSTLTSVNNAPMAGLSTAANKTTHAPEWSKGNFLRVMVILVATNLFLIVNAFGQLVTVGNVTMSNTAQVTIKGDMKNNTGASVNNNGTIDITGNFINDSGGNLFGSSAGEVILNGAAQSISGNTITQFSTLILDGTGVKTLGQDISTGTGNGVLELGDRQLDLNTYMLSVTNPVSTAVTRSSGFIISETNALTGYGTVRWEVGESSGNYTFPFGNLSTNSFLPVSFQITTPGSGSSGSISVSTYPTATNVNPNNRPLPLGLSTLMNTFGNENAPNVADRWWVMDVKDYSTEPTSNLIFTYRDSEWDASAGSTNVINEAALKAQCTDGAIWSAIPAGTANTSANNVTVTGANVYKEFWALVGNNEPLPLTLISFTAEPMDNKQVLLEWVTATEINNDYFTVERSRDGVNFEPIGTVDGGGNSSTILNYHFIDAKPYIGLSYYRLMQTDFDGNFSFSEIRAVRFEDKEQDTFSIFPNPAHGEFNVMFDTKTDSGKLMLVDMNGKVVKYIDVAETEKMADGLYRIDCQNIPAGMYFVTTPDGKMQKLVLQ